MANIINQFWRWWCCSGDPTLFEAYWNAHKDDHVKVGYANDTLSYFVKSKEQEGCPWFVSALLDDAIRELHSFVGNAVTGDRAIVVGNGSTQLFQAALYALATRDGTSTPVVSEAPFYSVRFAPLPHDHLWNDSHAPVNVVLWPRRTLILAGIDNTFFLEITTAGLPWDNWLPAVEAFPLGWWFEDLPSKGQRDLYRNGHHSEQSVRHYAWRFGVGR